MKLSLTVLILFIPFSVFSMDTYTFQVDLSSFTQKDLDNFKTMGTTSDPDVFKQTYLLANTSYYSTLKITPKTDKERDDLLAFVGNGFDLLGVYAKGGTFVVKEDHSTELKNIKSVPATGVKSEKP